MRQGDGGERENEGETGGKFRRAVWAERNQPERWNERGSGKEGGRRWQIAAQRLKGQRA